MECNIPSFDRVVAACEFEGSGIDSLGSDRNLDSEQYLSFAATPGRTFRASSCAICTEIFGMLFTAATFQQ